MANGEKLWGNQEWICERLIKMAENNYGEAKSFIPIPQILRKCVKLNGNEKDVLYHLLFSMNAKGYCYPSHRTIANELFMGESTVSRAISKLEQMYFIQKEEVIGSSNKYYLNKLEDNPYLYLTGVSSKFKRSFEPEGIPKGLCKNEVTEAAKEFLKKECDNFARRLYDGGDTESILSEYLQNLMVYVMNVTGIKIRPLDI